MDERDLPRLEQAIGEIWDKAREMGLDPFPTHFEIVPPSILYEFGAYLLPGRFQHWTHGKAYYQMKTHYDYGLSKIYELVINTNPSYAFLLESNSLLENKFVAAHVFGHTDFFKQNIWFGQTNRQMLETVEQNAHRIREYNIAEGDAEVERFLDAVLSISDHIDPYPRREREEPAQTPGRGKADPYQQLFRPDSKDSANHRLRGKGSERRRVPPEPEKDLLRFLMEHGDHLEEWQRDVIAIVRDESLYFVPQMQTKIMNEGWASYWHSHIMRELDLTDDEFLEFGRLHSSVCTPGRTRLNPYYLGLKIFEDIEQRLGREQIFTVREMENDASFIRTYLTEELVEELDLYVFAFDDQDWRVTEKAWEVVRDALVESFTNFGQPYITVEDGDYAGRRELYLKHYHDGRDLDAEYAEKTLLHVHQIWQHPVHLESLQGEKPCLFTCDGERVERIVL